MRGAENDVPIHYWTPSQEYDYLGKKIPAAPETDLSNGGDAHDFDPWAHFDGVHIAALRDLEAYNLKRSDAFRREPLSSAARARYNSVAENRSQSARPYTWMLLPGETAPPPTSRPASNSRGESQGRSALRKVTPTRLEGRHQT